MNEKLSLDLSKLPKQGKENNKGYENSQLLSRWGKKGSQTQRAPDTTDTFNDDLKQLNGQSENGGVDGPKNNFKGSGLTLQQQLKL